DVSTKKPIQTLTGDPRMKVVVFSPDDRMLASCGGPDNHCIEIWDAKTGKKLQTLTGHTAAIYSVAWAPDGKLLASCGEDEGIRIWDTARWKELAHLKLSKDEPAVGVAFSPDGKTLAAGTSDEMVFLFEVPG